MEYYQRPLVQLPQKEKHLELNVLLKGWLESILSFWTNIKSLGITGTMDDYEASKLSIFNQLNFFQFITGIIVPVIGLFHADQFPYQGWIMASLPACISIVVLKLNKSYLHKA